MLNWIDIESNWYRFEIKEMISIFCERKSGWLVVSAGRELFSYSILNIMGLMILQHKRHIIDWMLLHTLTANGFKTERIHTNWRHVTIEEGFNGKGGCFGPAESYSILNIVGLMILYPLLHTNDPHKDKRGIQRQRRTAFIFNHVIPHKISPSS